MQIFRPLRSRRALALATAALIAVPLAAPFLNAQQAPVPLAQAVSFADVVAATKPAVVMISVEIERPAGPVALPGQGGDPEEFLRRFFGEGPGGQPAPERGHGLGSGFIIDAGGTIVTNNHVVEGATAITVTLDDGRELAAELVGRDPKTDLAVIRVDAGAPLPFVPWGPSDDLRLGDPVVAIGNPFGVGTTVTSGIVSAFGRDLRSGPYDDFIQIDAAINRGNSGGPLFDVFGRVVGVNSAIYSPSGGSVGVGFAIPSSLAEGVVARLAEDGTVERGYLGVQLQPVTGDIASALGLPDRAGAIVADVVPDSPAAAAGLRQGDVILSLDGTAVGEPKDLSRMVADTAAGTDATLSVWRDGKAAEVAIEVGLLPQDEVAAAPQAAPQSAEAGLGLALSDLTPQIRRGLGLPEDVAGAVIAAVAEDSPAADEGLRPGDVILSVNTVAVTDADTTIAAIMAAAEGGRDSVLLLVGRGSDTMFVALPLGNA
jgi:serine protease Do